MMNKVKALFITLGKGIKYLWREHHFLVPISMWKDYFLKFKRRSIHRSGILYYDLNNFGDYNRWLDKHVDFYQKKEVKLSKAKIIIIIEAIDFNQNDIFSTIASIRKQKNKNFEIIILTNKKIENNDEYKFFYVADKEEMFGVINNYSLEFKESYFFILSAGDLLEDYTLSLVSECIAMNPEVDVIYGDEDDIVNGGKFNAKFKPDFSPDTLLSYNYIGEAVLFKGDTIDKLGGFESSLGSRAIYDMLLRLINSQMTILHIPAIIFHKKDLKKRIDCDKSIVLNYLDKKGIIAKLEVDELTKYNLITYNLNPQPMVSIIIPTRDFYEITNNCLTSLFEKTTYKNYEVILVDNGSIQEETFKMFNYYKEKYNNFRVIRDEGEFNFSRLNNFAASVAEGEVLVLLNNDTEIISSNWLDIMVSYAMQPHVGAVGPKLLYEDNTVQHGGIILGLGDVAAHAYLNAKENDIGYMGDLRVPHDCGAVTAACLAIEKSKFIEVGMLNEDLKVAYNDVELNIKLLKKGLFNVLVPNVKLYHLESKSRGLDTTKEKYKIFQRERSYMLEKYPDYIEKDPFYNDNFAKNEYDANFLLKDIK